MKIRSYRESDYAEIAELFHQSVHAIDELIYSAEQKEAWSPTPPDFEFWQQRLTRTKPIVAEKSQTIIGFIEFESDGHIDCLYVHPSYQRLGIASILLERTQDLARDKGMSSIYVEASKIAVPVFQKFGFSITGTNEVIRRGCSLTNYSMVLALK